MDTIIQWIYFLAVAVPIILIAGSEKMSNTQKFFWSLAVIVVFILVYLSVSGGEGGSYLQEVCPDCNQF